MCNGEDKGQSIFIEFLHDQKTQLLESFQISLCSIIFYLIISFHVGFQGLPQVSSFAAENWMVSNCHSADQLKFLPSFPSLFNLTDKHTHRNDFLICHFFSSTRITMYRVHHTKKPFRSLQYPYEVKESPESSQSASLHFLSSRMEISMAN